MSVPAGVEWIQHREAAFNSNTHIHTEEIHKTATIAIPIILPSTYDTADRSAADILFFLPPVPALHLHLYLHLHPKPQLTLHIGNHR